MNALVHMTVFGLFGMDLLNMLSLNTALIGVHFDLALWCLCYETLSFFFFFFVWEGWIFITQVQR